MIRQITSHLLEQVIEIAHGQKASLGRVPTGEIGKCPHNLADQLHRAAGHYYRLPEHIPHLQAAFGHKAIGQKNAVGRLRQPVEQRAQGHAGKIAPPKCRLRQFCPVYPQKETIKGQPADFRLRLIPPYPRRPQHSRQLAEGGGGYKKVIVLRS